MNKFKLVIRKLGAEEPRKIIAQTLAFIALQPLIIILDMSLR